MLRANSEGKDTPRIYEVRMLFSEAFPSLCRQINLHTGWLSYIAASQRSPDSVKGEHHAIQVIRTLIDIFQYKDGNHNTPPEYKNLAAQQSGSVKHRLILYAAETLLKPLLPSLTVAEYTELLDTMAEDIFCLEKRMTDMDGVSPNICLSVVDNSMSLESDGYLSFIMKRSIVIYDDAEDRPCGKHRGGLI